MLKLKTKWFNKWAKRNVINDEILNNTIEHLANNLGTTNLGGGLYKVRTRRIGQGKGSSFRTLVVFKKDQIAVFIYGFAKTDKNNLDTDELKYFTCFVRFMQRQKLSYYV
jgi:hypothetical protein